MCIGGSSSPPPPPAPPPPPPVLEQQAPETSAPTTSESLNTAAMGTRRYRTSRTTGVNSNSGSQAGGLSISK